MKSILSTREPPRLTDRAHRLSEEGNLRSPSLLLWVLSLPRDWLFRQKPTPFSSPVLFFALRVQAVPDTTVQRFQKELVAKKLCAEFRVFPLSFYLPVALLLLSLLPPACFEAFECRNPPPPPYAWHRSRAPLAGQQGKQTREQVVQRGKSPPWVLEKVNIGDGCRFLRLSRPWGDQPWGDQPWSETQHTLPASITLTTQHPHTALYRARRERESNVLHKLSHHSRFHDMLIVVGFVLHSPHDTYRAVVRSTAVPQLHM